MTEPMDRLGRLLAELPGRLEQAQAQAAELAAQPFEAQSSDGSVAATVDGSGQLTGVELSAARTGRMDNLTVGERIAEAVNGALDTAEAARERLLAAGAPDGGDVAGAEELFQHRMAELERVLDSVEARLRGMAGD